MSKVNYKDFREVSKDVAPHCLKFSVFGVFLVHISRIWTEYGEILRICPYLGRMRENLDQKKSEYRHFSRSDSVFIINLEQLYAYMNLQEDKKYIMS